MELTPKLFLLQDAFEFPLSLGLLILLESVMKIG